MAFSTGNDGALAQRANLNIAAAVVAKLGTSASDSLIGSVINEVRASHSVAELASAGGMSGLLGAVDTAIARNGETNRPFNTTDSRAAQLAQQGNHLGGHGHHDGSGFGRYGLLLGGRGAREPGGDGGESSGSSGGGSSRTSSTYAANGTGNEPAGAPFWGTAKGMMLTRGYANDNNMSWAPPDLMQMGRPALQAIKESGLKGDGYQALRKPSGLNLSNDSIVAGAGYMQRRHLNHNEAAKAGAAVYEHPSMTPESKKEWRSAVDRKQYPEGPAGDAAYAEGIRQAATRGKEQRPEMTPEYNRALKAYGADKDAGLDAKAGANKSEAGAKKDDAQAKKDESAAKKDASETKQKDTTAAKMQEQAKNRRAAAQNNFGSL